MHYIIKLLLSGFLAMLSVMSVYTQTTEPTQDDVRLIERYIKLETDGWKSGYYYKQAIRMGDSTAKALFKLYPEKDASPEKVIAYLSIVYNAFSKPDAIENPSDRIPMVTYQLLQALEKDFLFPKVQSELKNTKEYIEKQLTLDLLNRKIEPFSKENFKINDLLKDVAERADIYIGIDINPNDKIIEFYYFNGGRLIDILNDLVRIYPKYKWVIKDDIVNVFTERTGTSFLEVGVFNLRLNEMNLKDTLQVLTELTEVKSRLINLGIKSVTLNELSNKPNKITATFDNIWVFELLNKLVKASSNRIWSVTKAGNNIICKFE